MRCLLLSWMSLLSFCANSQQVDVGLYTNILVANEEVVKSNDVSLIQGDNQLVVEFDGRLKQNTKTVTVSVRPQIIIVADIASSTDKLEIKLAAKTTEELETLQMQQLPLFQVYVNGEFVKTSQQELPAQSGLFPYRDPLALVKQYNDEQGLIFDSGNIRMLKKELEMLPHQPSTLSTDVDTEATLQLKLWYSRATDEERVIFRKWLANQ